jgi:hypothetical protein
MTRTSPFLILALGHGRETFLFAVETAGGSGEAEVLHAGHLYDGAFRREVAPEADDAAGWRDRVVGRADHVLVRVPRHALHVLGQRAAGHGHAVAVQEAVVEQRLHEDRDAARLKHVLGDVAAARLQVGDVGRALEDLGDVEEVELDAAFMRDGRQVQAGIGRAAGGGDHGRGILQRFPGHDIARADVAGDELHDLFARRHAEAVADLIGSGAPAE